MRKSTLLLLATTFAGLAISPAFAEWHEHDGFHYHDYDYWRNGSWVNGYHGGQNGWWWVADGHWYSYPAPVYPYPDPYTPGAVVVESAPTPPGVAPSYAYYCVDPAGYYPSVPQCYGAWQRVEVGAVAVAQAEPAPMASPPPVAVTGEVAPGSQMDNDEHQLAYFEAKLQTIGVHDRHARTKLNALSKQVDEFRQALLTRDYNAMDILRHTEDLEHKIAETRYKIPKHVAVAPHPTPAQPPVPMPTSSAPPTVPMPQPGMPMPGMPMPGAQGAMPNMAQPAPAAQEAVPAPVPVPMPNAQMPQQPQQP